MVSPEVFFVCRSTFWADIADDLPSEGELLLCLTPTKIQTPTHVSLDTDSEGAIEHFKKITAYCEPSESVHDVRGPECCLLSRPFFPPEL